MRGWDTEVLATARPPARTSFIYIGEFTLTIYDKPFKTYNEQIELLKSRGLIVEDYGFAYHALSTLSYYDLITRYQRYFMPDGKKFIDNITIELLYNFSLFDRSVQAFILKYSLLIENIVKTKLSHIMAKDFGVNEVAYLSASKYRESFKLPNNESLKFSSLAFECKKAIIDPKIARDPTLYYHRKHNHIPPWILLKNLSFNNTISLIKLLRNKQRNRIINELVPFPQVRLRDKTNFVFCSLGAIRLFHDFAACNLDFTTLYTYEINHLSPTILSKLLDDQYLIKSENDRIPLTEKAFSRGLYGVMLSMLVYLKGSHLVGEFITDFLYLFKDFNDSDSADKKRLFKYYSDIANMPADTPVRLQSYLSQYKQANNDSQSFPLKRI